MTQKKSSRIIPGQTIGILGGGQLGRMTAIAARALGYQVHALDPDPQCPVRPVVDRFLDARFDEPDAAAYLARRCAVVTLEIEQISQASLEAAAQHAPVRPGVELMRIVQHRARQKAWLTGHGFPVGEWREASSEDELVRVAPALGVGAFVKVSEGGYDGRGQARLRTADASGAREAWKSLGEVPCVIERALDLEAELSVLVARSPSGEVKVFAAALNEHINQVLDVSVTPAPVDPIVAQRAHEIGADLAVSLGLEGILAVELFLLRDGSLKVNELSPRPHNTFHATELASPTSQFAQLVRAVCDLPLGVVDPVRPAAIANLLGDLWCGPNPPRIEAALEVPGVNLYLYGKTIARPGRKMGHLISTGDNPEDAMRRVREARARIEASVRT
ncbi:MAG: 5-(carboxyamino)imidazole ribonucleotide synthase [Deltaproteobacteria bacterium]|nr:5-(carboxyamino)imidazole ribonucleotide synthase [Deltaproteobacteria bacterium]